MPKWTPPELFAFPEVWDFQAVVYRLFEIFDRDLIKNRTLFRGLEVVFDNRYEGDSLYPEGFWHVITHGKDNRTIDTERACRLPWLRPIVENPGCPEILIWSETDLDRRGSVQETWYLWYETGDYLVVLKEKPNRYFLATAFYVTGQRNRDYYMTKYQKKGNQRLAGPSAPSTLGG